MLKGKAREYDTVLLAVEAQLLAKLSLSRPCYSRETLEYRRILAVFRPISGWRAAF